MTGKPLGKGALWDALGIALLMMGSGLSAQAAISEEDMFPAPVPQYRGTKYTDDPRFKELQAAFPVVWRRAWIGSHIAVGLGRAADPP